MSDFSAYLTTKAHKDCLDRYIARRVEEYKKDTRFFIECEKQNYVIHALPRRVSENK